MRYEMRDLKTGRIVQATREQRELLLKIGRAEDVRRDMQAEGAKAAAEDAPKPTKKAAKKAAKRTYKRRDMQAEEE